MKILTALQQIADPETRDKAVANHKEALRAGYEYAHEDVEHEDEALLYGFPWDTSPEGDNHWSNIHDVLNRKRLSQPDEITERFMNDDYTD